MDREQLIEHCNRIIGLAQQAATSSNHGLPAGITAQALEFLRVFGGPRNSFFEELKVTAGKYHGEYLARRTASIVEAFKQYMEAGLSSDIAPERLAQLNVVSDFLEQAQILLNAKGVHPAAPAVIVGASLEEFLRTWIEDANLSLGNRKPSLESYSQVLREADLVTKQDAKDITAWGGVRNHAAHGEWDAVSDPQRIRLMLEGVNLFMRKYGA